MLFIREPVTALTSDLVDPPILFPVLFGSGGGC